MKVIVVGGGAAGMMAAITASQNGNEVTILEHKDRLGKKILATGNGRCNLSNSLLKDNPGAYYRSAALNNPNEGSDEVCDFINKLFMKFSYDDTMQFFAKLGLCVKSKGTLMYPYSEQASAVLDVLRFAVRDLNINVITECDVVDIHKSADIFTVKASGKGTYTADKVILATGSKAQPKLGADGLGYELLTKTGHKIATVTPSLVQLVASVKGKQDIFKSLAGVRVHAQLELFSGSRSIAKESGELQLTSYGISGIAVMNLSTYISPLHRELNVNVDLAPDYSKEEIREYINNKCSKNSNRLSEELLIGLLPKKLGDIFLKLSGIGFNMQFSKISDDCIEKLIALIKKWNIVIEKTNSFEDAQICMGGLPVSELKPNLESVRIPGLYVAGELIDAHGPCGGFNLQQAWSSGAVAGRLE